MVRVMRNGSLLFFLLVCFFLISGPSAVAAERSEVPSGDRVGNGENTPRVGADAPRSPSFIPEGLQELLADKTIHAGDRLDIKLFPQQDLSSSRYVDNDGYIFFPYLGMIKVVGLSVDDVSKQMADSLGAKYLQNPQVFVRKDTEFQEKMFLWWKDAYTKPINVVGQVGHPGAFYPVREDVSLVEVINNQGSFLDTADLATVRVIRLTSGKTDIFFADMGAILAGTAPDIIVKKGDLIIVPKKDNKLIHILGEVNHPGPLDINEFLKEKMTLVEAISRAGGFARSAAANRVRLIRVVNGKEVVTKIKGDDILKGKEKDVVLQAGDLIIVPEAFW